MIVPTTSHVFMETGLIAMRFIAITKHGLAHLENAGEPGIPEAKQEIRIVTDTSLTQTTKKHNTLLINLRGNFK